MDGDNLVGTLGDFKAANFTLDNAQNLALDGAVEAGTAGDPEATPDPTEDVPGNIALTSTGTITQDSGGTLTTHGGDVTIQGSSVALGGNNAAGAGDVSLIADSLDITGTISSDSRVVIRQLTNNRDILLGNEDAGALSLKGAELDQITAGTIAIGDADSGNLDIAGSIAPAHATALSLHSGGAISQSGGSITVGTLSGSSVGATTLNHTGNAIDTLGSFTAAGFTLINGQALTVAGAVDGGTSVALTTSAGGITLNAGITGGAVTLDSAGAVKLNDVSADSLVVDAANAITQAGTNGLVVTGTSQFTAGAGITLGNTANDFGGAVTLDNQPGTG
ncbi:MAG: hypothetical protein ACTS5I_08585, partial [Rhodanobacter sp.]